MKVLILGDKGFIGSEIINTLSNSSKIDSKALEIMGLDRYSESMETPLIMDSGALFVHKQCDCSSFTNIEVSSVINQCQPNVIINCAAEVGVSNVKENAIHVGMNNFMSSYNLCNSLIQFKKEFPYIDYQPLIIFFSSSEVYGNTTNASVKNNIYELFPEYSRSSYALSKLLEENLYHELKNYGYENVIIMRLFNIVGETQSDRFVLPKLVKISKSYEEVFHLTPTFRKFCHVDFLTDCIERIIYFYDKERKTTFPILTNFTSFREENYVSMMELVHIASRVCGRMIPTKIETTKPEDIIYRKSEIPNIPPKFLDRSKDISLEEILRKMYV